MKIGFIDDMVTFAVLEESEKHRDDIELRLWGEKAQKAKKRYPLAFVMELAGGIMFWLGMYLNTIPGTLILIALGYLVCIAGRIYFRAFYIRLLMKHWGCIGVYFGIGLLMLIFLFGFGFVLMPIEKGVAEEILDTVDSHFASVQAQQYSKAADWERVKSATRDFYGSKKTWYCPGCGRENFDAFCPVCGMKKPD